MTGRPIESESRERINRKLDAAQQEQEKRAELVHLRRRLVDIVYAATKGKDEMHRCDALANERLKMARRPPDGDDLSQTFGGSHSMMLLRFWRRRAVRGATHLRGRFMVAAMTPGGRCCKQLKVVFC
ncbi:unnamed protein product [Vitrella brassicaformis CCMP3155]|uniref:Uncharacterized protein n=1 Tax=Vitrella brassicaformis (strain CCMP3155) TaxID=1169540 RepID=A0A0G4EPK5_VITBC|nr:unnamed protein product [Vitrella brassicaformis CCMP3155]|eukprot:CEL99763.1 unnamed protein product [Vitrella brassicaformis CCMP3155]